MEPYVLPFNILIDTAEGHPWQFQGMESDSDKKNRPLICPIKYQCLGRHPNSFGDYSIEGMTDHVGVERKSLEDVQSTILNWSGGRDRFECELSNLNSLRWGVVVIEASIEQALSTMPQRGIKPAEVNAKIFFRSWISYQQRFPKVQWAWCGGRRLAEMYTLNYLRRCFRKYYGWSQDARRIEL